MAKASIADRYLKTLEDNALENSTRSPPKSLKSSPVKNKETSPLKESPVKQKQSPVKETSTPTKQSTKSNRKVSEQFEFKAYKFTPKRSLDPTMPSPTAKQDRPQTSPIASPQRTLDPKLAARTLPSPSRGLPTPNLPAPKLNTGSTPTAKPTSTSASSNTPSSRSTATTPLTKSAATSLTKSAATTQATNTVAAKTPTANTASANTTSAKTTQNTRGAVRSMPKSATLTSVASGTPRLASTPSEPSISLAHKPDRHLLMHNQDLSPSQVSWDSERKNWQAYEYLCHIVEAKEWMEKVLGEQLPPAEQFPESLQNGIALAKIVQKIKPELMKWPVFEHKRLQYRHTENITLFFDMLRDMKIPQLFWFDMTDLYEKRNLPKVIYCIHAVSHFIAESDFALSAVDNLVGKLQFSDDQLIHTEKGMQGQSMPNFGAMTRQLSGKQPKLEVDDDENIEYDPVREKELEEARYDEEEDDEEVDEFSYSDVGYNQDTSRRRRRSSVSVSFRDDSIGDATLDELTEARARRRNLYRDSAYSDEDTMGDDTLDIAPPRRYRNANRDRYARDRDLSRGSLYNERYSQYDQRQYRGEGYGHRNLSSTGKFRSKVLSAAEIMLMELEELEPEIAAFQGICRGHLARRKENHVFKKPEAVALITNVQAIARGMLYRRNKARKQPELSKEDTESLVQLQSLVRAQRSRRHFNNTANRANGIVDFQALARGVLARRQREKLGHEMSGKDSKKLIVGLQSGFRGVLLRFKLGCLYDELETDLPHTIQLQAFCRGALVRRTTKRSSENWEKNTDKIILLQSVWRAKAQGSRYRTLLWDRNPSLQALKPFLHLYEDNDADFKNEVELEAVMRKIAKHMKHNEGLQSRIDQLDMKIALLVKNDISIDELLLQQQKQNQDLRLQMLQEKNIDDEFGNFHTGKNAHGGNGLKDQFDIKLLQKPSRERFELYQGLLYILQTQSVYVSKLMNNTPPRSLDMAHIVMAIYGDGKSKREQFYLLKQLSTSITQSTVGSAENTVAWRIVSQLNHTKESTDVARRILEPATTKLNALSEQILEYDPHLIYENITGGADMNAEEAIQDPAVRAIFVQNLRLLREVTLSIVQSLANNVNDLPFHIRFLAREVYREIMRCNNDHDEALSAVGQIVISQYLEPALLAADSLELVDAAVGNTTKNLSLVGRVLHQVGVMQRFDNASSTDIYLRPLNEFVKSSALHIGLGFQTSIVECPDLQTHFNMSEFDDITMHVRPALNISMDNLLALHYMCYNHISSIATSNDNTLKPLVQQLGPLPKDSREMLDLARFKDVKLELNPKYCASSLHLSSPESSSLLATTKRCLVYVLRIQNSQPDLMSVLVNPVEVEDEIRYNLLMDTDGNREKAGELANLTFRELKLLTLEKVLELESSGAVSRSDDYQALINAIANDIRNKDAVRQKKNMNTDNKQRNLRSLEEKGVYLQQRLDSYNKHINEALESLLMEAHQQSVASNNKPFQKFQIPGTKMHTKGDSNNEARYGQYKTTADKLYERGVLMRLQGYTDRQRKDVHVTLSCDRVAVFQIDVTYKGILLPNGHAEISLDDLLAHQYQNEQTLGFVGGQLQFNTNRLLQLILTKFMSIQRQQHQQLQQ